MKVNNSSESEAIRVLIVDDESLARKRIKDLLSGRESEFEIVGECSNGKKAIKAIQEGVADLVFLDIQMRDMDGFEVLENLKGDSLPTIIFVTAYDKYALKAFEFHAVDYLLKPFDNERFEETLEHAKKLIKKNQISDLSEKLNNLLSDYQDFENASKTKTSKNGYQKRLVIKSAGKVQFVEVEDIDWAGAEGSYVSLNINGKAHLMRGTLKKLEETLNPEKFLRIHRSTIVNVERITELKSHFHGEYIVILKNGKRLKLSRNYRDKAEKLLGGQF